MTQMAQGNTRNHWERTGQNVLYADGHVESQIHPFVGVGHDNIYTFGAAAGTTGGEGIEGPPRTRDDSVLLPVATADPTLITPPEVWERRSECLPIRRFRRFAQIKEMPLKSA